MESVPLKVCSGCKEAKPLSEYCRNSQAKDGLNWYCRPCWNAKGRNRNRKKNLEWQRKRREENYEEYMEKRRAYEEQNRERIKGQQRRRYHENAETKREQQRRYREENLEDVRSRQRVYYAKNKEKMRRVARERHRKNLGNPEYVAKMRIRTLDYLHRRRVSGEPSKEARDYAAVVRYDPCSYCGRTGGTMDHVVPISMGGTHDAENMTGACQSCNSSKRNKSLLIFLLYRKE